MMSAKLCKRKRGDTADYREDREIKIIRKSDCAQTRPLAKRGHIDRFEENRNGGIIYIKTRPKPFPCKKTIKLESAWRKNRFDGFPVPPLLFCPAISPRHFAPAISLPPFRPRHFAPLFRLAILPRYFAPPFCPAISPRYFALLFRPAISPCYFAPAISRKQDDKKSKRKSFRIHLNRTTTEKVTRKF